LEVLERGLDLSRSEVCVMDLAAEPGMGKSRLLHEFRQRIGKEGASRPVFEQELVAHECYTVPWPSETKED
jgi:predicted ATPase